MDESADVVLQMTELRRHITRLDKTFSDFREFCAVKDATQKIWKIALSVLLAATFGLSGYFVASLKSHEQSAYHMGMPEYVKHVTLPVSEQVIENRLELRETQVNYRNLQVQMDRIETKLDKVIEEM